MAVLRLVTWNLHGSAKPRLDAVADLLRSHEPDVIALQEVRRGQMRRVSGLLRWRRPAWTLKHNAYCPLWWRAEGLAVLSRHRLAVHPPILLTPGVSRRSYQRRVVLPVEVVIEDERRVLLLNAHLTSNDDADDQRLEQCEHISAVLPDNLPVTLAGDLNATPDRASIRFLVAAGLLDAWDAAGAGDGATIPANAPRRRIDYVMVRGLRVLDAAVIDDFGPAMSGLSDHRPVVATLELADAAPQ